MTSYGFENNSRALLILGLQNSHLNVRETKKIYNLINMLYICLWSVDMEHTRRVGLKWEGGVRGLFPIKLRERLITIRCALMLNPVECSFSRSSRVIVLVSGLRNVKKLLVNKII